MKERIQKNIKMRDKKGNNEFINYTWTSFTTDKAS